MNPAIKQLRKQIKQYESFIELCDRIKQLEKAQNSYPKKLISLEDERAQVSAQLAIVAEELARLERSADKARRTVGTVEEAQLQAMIKAVQVRQATLNNYFADVCKQAALLEGQAKLDEDELNSLYTKLDEFVQAEGMNPDTVHEDLAELRRQKDLVSDAMKAEISVRGAPNAQPSRSNTAQLPDALLNEADFFRALYADLAQAKKNIEVVSALLSSERGNEVIAALAQLTAAGRNVTIHTTPASEYHPNDRQACYKLLTDAHRQRITVIQRSGIEYNVVIIDNLIAWEGSVSILGTSKPGANMRRTMASSHVRELRHYLFGKET